MRDISRRLDKIEKKLNLNLNEKPEMITIVLYDKQSSLLPDRTEGRIRYVYYKDIEQEARAEKATKNN